MRNIPLFAGLMFFWIIYITFIHYVNADSSLGALTSVGNESGFIIDSGTTSLLNTTDYVTDTKSLSGFGKTASVMFGFSLGIPGADPGVSAFFSLINWLLVLVTIAVVWRIANPFGGGS